MTLNAEQKEELRHAVLRALAVRAPAALRGRQIVAAAKKELPFLFEEPDVAAACGLLAGLAPALVDMVRDDLGTTAYWRATSAGVLKAEREEMS